MAVDKLVDSTQLNTDLTSVANAIRTRGGTSAQLAYPNGFITAIEDIPDTGSSLVIVYEDNGGGSFNFLTSYSDIKSAVRNGDAVCFVRDDTLAVGGVVDYRTNYTTQSVTFTECVRLYMQDEELDIYLVTYGYSGGTLQQVSELKYLIPSGTKPITENGTGIDVKRYASVDVSVSSGGDPSEYMEKYLANTLTTYKTGISELRGNALRGSTINTFICTALTTVFTYSFGYTSIKTIDISGTISSFGSNTFNSSSSLNVLILRKNSLIALSNTNAFTATPFASNGTGGTLYVPQSLISSYQSATNWSTILGYANNSIQAIEGSIYENAYADGTPIS